MLPNLEKIPQTPPYALIEWLLKRQGRTLEELAIQGGISMENLQAILNKKEIDFYLSEVLGKIFGADKDYFLKVQKQWNKELEYQKLPKPTPNLANIRPVVFWDAIFVKIDWIRAEKWIIQRVFERGNELEKQEIIAFYGREKVITTLKDFCNQNISNEQLENLHQYRIPIAFGNFLQT